MSGGEDADWELVATIPTGNPHTDLDFFTRNGETYASVGTLGIGPNGGGQTIVKLTEKRRGQAALRRRRTRRRLVPEQPERARSASSTTSRRRPKGDAILNTFNPRGRHGARRSCCIDATDAAGRCHDQGVGGLASAPRGGLEIIDVTDPAAPKEIGLTTHIGEAHTVNVDPKRPHIAYS